MFLNVLRGLLQAIDANFHFVQKLVPPMVVVLQHTLGIEEHEAPHMAVGEHARRNASDDVAVIHKAERFIPKLMIETAGKNKVPDARLAKRIESIDRRMPLQDMPGDRHASEGCPQAVAGEPNGLRLVLESFDGAVYFVPDLKEPQVKAAMNQARCKRS